MATDAFRWPCARRDAHKPHDVPACEASDPQPGTVSPFTLVPCPGVNAHPFTMIGGAYPDVP